MQKPRLLPDTEGPIVLVGLNTAAAGMAAQQQRLDATANDLANVSTTGYKRVRVGFEDLVHQRANWGAADAVRTGSGARTTDAGRAWSQGALRETGVSTDLAIEGDGFLPVRAANGRTVLTRDGGLQVDNRGELVTNAGLRMVPPIVLPQGKTASDLAIAPDGEVTVDQQVIGRIEVVRVRAPRALEANGDNTFTVTAAAGRPIAVPRDETRVRQGALESSNVDVADAMTDLIDSQRSYQLASKAIQTADQMWEIANGVKR